MNSKLAARRSELLLAAAALVLGAIVVACTSESEESGKSEPEAVEQTAEDATDKEPIDAAKEASEGEEETPVEVTEEIPDEAVQEVQTEAGEWEVWLSDQADSADISADDPSGSYGSRIVIYESSDILAAPPGRYAEDDPEYGPTVIEAVDVFPSALKELGVNVRRLHGMLMHPPTHRYVNANFFGPGVGLVGHH